MVDEQYNITHILALLGIVALVVLSGCTAGPFGEPPEQDQPPRVVLNNSANETQTFTVWVVEGEIHPDEITIYKQDREIDNASLREGLSTYHLGGDYGNVTSVGPPANRSRLLGRYTLAPGEASRSSIENFTVGSTIVISLSESGRVIELTVTNCDEQALVGLEVTSRPDPPGGASASYGCQ